MRLDGLGRDVGQLGAVLERPAPQPFGDVRRGPPRSSGNPVPAQAAPGAPRAPGVSVGAPRRTTGVGDDPKPRAAAGALPPALAALAETGKTYFKLLAAGSRSIHQEVVRLTLLVELFGAAAVASAIAEVMQTGHVGAEYVEYVMRHKRGLVPHAAPLRLGNDELDAIALARRVALSTPFIFSENATLSRQERCGNNA